MHLWRGPYWTGGYMTWFAVNRYGFWYTDLWNIRQRQPDEMLFFGAKKWRFLLRCILLANVNSCSRSLYVVVRPSVVCLSVTFVHPPLYSADWNIRNVSAPFNTLVTWRNPGKILRRSSQGNPSVVGLNQRVVEKCSDFGPYRGYISKTVQDRR